MDPVARGVAEAFEHVLATLGRSGNGAAPLQLTVVSSLAEGADRLVVHELRRAHDLRLEAVLPLPPEDYRRDFHSAASRAEFDAMLARASGIEIVSAAGDRDAAYERAGQRVVDRSDVMIAVWDGEPARGRGGTAHIVDYARHHGRPVYWVSTRTPQTRGTESVERVTVLEPLSR